MKNYAKVFAFLRDQKAFTAFMTTLVLIGSVSAVFAAKVASAEIYAFETASDKLSDARKSVAATHTVRFAPGTQNGGQPFSNGAAAAPLTILFKDFNNPGTNTVTAAHVTLTGVTTVANVGACTGPTNPEMYVTSVSGAGIDPVVTLGLCPNDSIATGVGVTVTVGSGVNQFVNPATLGAHTITVTGTGTNTHKSDLLVAIVDSVHLSAVVDPIFNFSVAGVNTGMTPVVGMTTNITSSSSAVDFGTLASGTAKMGAQTLRVQSNAKEGFNVTVQSTSEFQSANGAIIDGFNAAGVPITVPAAWAVPAGTLANAMTWGHIGLSSSDIVGANPFAGVGLTNRWVGNFILNEVSVMDGTTVTDGSGVGGDQGLATVFYRSEITDLQEAATDYKTDIVYVATPTF